MTPTEKRIHALLKEALPIIEREAEQRETSGLTGGYWSEMRQLAAKFAFAIAELERMAASSKEREQ